MAATVAATRPVPPPAQLGSNKCALGQRPIFFCCHEPVWPLTGGSTGGNLALLRELSAAGLNPVAITPYNGSFLQARRGVGVRLEPFRPFLMHRSAPLRMARYALYGFLYFFVLFRKVRQRKPFLLICRNSVLALPVYAVAKLNRIPTAIVLADLLSFFFWNRPSPPPRWQRLFRWFECWMVGLYDKIFVVTTAMAEEIVRQLEQKVQTKISVTRDGVRERFLSLSDADFAAAKQVRSSICGEAPLALFYGTLERHHGMDEILRIVSLLLDTTSDFHALIIGGGPCRASLLRSPLARHGRAHLLDFMDVETLIRYGLAADVGMIPYPSVPSTNMIYTFKFLEYRCLGLPVVAFPLETLRREFHQCPGLHLAKNSIDFVDAVVRFGRERKRYFPQEDFRRRFSWREVAAPIIQEAMSHAGDGRISLET
ncbi:MAG TPA: glycosyltransferase family 4 protein [Terrimicrobiaceae bacterium]